MNKYLEAFNNFKMLMGDSSQFTKVESLVVLVHSIIRSNGLMCLDGVEQFEFPVSWRTQKDSTYTFTYKNNRNNATLKVTATQKENKLEVIFHQMNSSLSYRTMLNLDQTDDQNAKNFDLNFQQYLKQSGKKSHKPEEFIRDTNTKKINAPIQSVYSQDISAGGYPPRNLINPPSSFNNPFGQQEYVGPNSEVFSQPYNPYQNVQPFPGSPQIPLGARYDPIDPFDNPLREKPRGPQEFFGFDEFGRPKKAPFGGMNNRGGRGGFGGNFGGDFGGMGGGFGPNFGV